MAPSEPDLIKIHLENRKHIWWIVCYTRQKPTHKHLHAGEQQHISEQDKRKHAATVTAWQSGGACS